MASSGVNDLIQVSENGRYFIRQNGEPFFWLGDTQWEIFRTYNLDEAEIALENRRLKGFNIIQIMVTGTGNGTKPNFSGEKPWLNDNPAMPNEAYFKNVDEVIKLGYQKGLIFVLGVFHQMQTSYITLANARFFARWLSERYRDMPNVIWTSYPKAEKEFVPILREIAAGLREGDDGKHLITVHPDPSPASSSFIHSEDWLACNMIQTWAAYDLIYDMVTYDYNLTPTKPVVMAEGAYENGSEYGFPITPLLVRKQAYWSYLSGGYHSYGHNDIWRKLPTWKSALDAPGAYQLGILKDMFTDRNWWQLVPDQSLIVTQEKPKKVFNTASRSISSDWAIVYLDRATAITIDLRRLSAANAVEAVWMNPANGTQERIGTFPNTSVQIFTPPDRWEDAVLLLNK